MTSLAFIQNLGAGEWIAILAVVVLLFGAKKLPELGSSVGKTIKNFKRGIEEGKAENAEAEPESSHATTESQ